MPALTALHPRGARGCGTLLGAEECQGQNEAEGRVLLWQRGGHCSCEEGSLTRTWHMAGVQCERQELRPKSLEGLCLHRDLSWV